MQNKLISIIITSLITISVTGCTNLIAQEREELAKLNLSNKSELKSPAERDKAAKIYANLCIKYIDTDYIKRAQKKLVRAMELSPDLPEVKSAEGYYWEKVGEFTKAEAAHKRAIKLGGKAGAYHNNYATFLCRRERFAEADKSFNCALSDDYYDSAGSVLGNAGLCALQWQKIDLAEQYFQRAILRNPDLQYAYLELAKIYQLQGKAKKAQEYLKHYKQDYNNSAESVKIAKN